MRSSVRVMSLAFLALAASAAPALAATPPKPGRYEGQTGDGHVFQFTVERSKKAKDNATYFIKLLKERGLDSGMSKDTAVVPLIVGNSVLCLQLSDALKKRGINVQPILYPAVEEDQARLRFFLSSLHSPDQLLHTANVAKEELERLKREMDGDAVA